MPPGRAYLRVMVAADRGERRRRFPALDPEPPPRSWRRRALLPLAVVLLAATAWAAAQAWPSSPRPVRGRAAGRPVVAAGGRIVVQTAGGALALAEPNGAHLQLLRVSGLMPSSQIHVAAAPGGGYLATTDGQLITMSAGKPATATTVPFSGLPPLLPANPFADHDRAIVELRGFAGYPSANTPVSVYSLATKRRVGLGDVDGSSNYGAAGDPRAAGVIVAVAAPPRPSATVTGARPPDSRVELRDAGRPTVLLAGAAALSRDVGLSPRRAVALFPYPDPSGRKIAVQVNPISGRTGGVVVLNRAGRVLGSVSAAFGPLAGVSPVWSADGRSIAYPAIGTSGRELTIWTIGGEARTQTFPDADLTYPGCLWSPDGSAVLCAGYRGLNPTPQRWAIASVSGTRMASVVAPGVPVAWLPGELRTGSR